MKYLRKFNESQTDFKKQLQDFCETYLAYLIDDGFIVKIGEFDELDGFELIIKKEEYNNRQPLFIWDVVKDHIGPFIYYLDKEYELYKAPEKIGRSEPGDIGILQYELEDLFEPFSVEEIIDDNYNPILVTSETKLEYILIYAVLKKIII